MTGPIASRGRTGPVALVLVLAALWLGLTSPAAAIEVTRVKSPGGIEAWLIEDHTNPIIALGVAFHGGAALDPAGKEGLAEMVSGLLDEGAGDLESLAFQRRLEDTSISISFSAAFDRFSGQMQTLTEFRDEAFDLLRLAINEPRFDPEPVERIRSQILAGLASEAESPRYIAGRAWWEATFPNHPYGRPAGGTPDSIKAITADDLRTFVRSRLARDNLVVGVVGDITPAELAPLLDKTFGALPAKAAPAQVAEITPLTSGKVTVIRRPNPQSVVVFGQRGLKRSDPDFYAAYVMNYLLGGGSFNSRLYEEVREKRGLAYSVYSSLVPLDRSGLIIGGVGTQNPRAKESIDLIRAEWRRMATEGVSEEELQAAKRFLTGSFPLRFSSSSRIANMLVFIQLDDLGIDYLDRRNGFIEAVTREDIRRVARTLLDADALSFVVVGDPDGFSGG